MYHHQREQYHYNQESNNTRRMGFAHSPKAVVSGITMPSPRPTSSTSPNVAHSPRIRINNGERHSNLHPHELDIQEVEAEADYKEYVMYQRIMEHRSKLTKGTTGESIPTMSTLSNPQLQPTSHNLFLNAAMIERLRDELTHTFDHQHILDLDEEESESEQGIFELDM
jgi:6-pyruvoyl-tetrahydropterin synthase